MDQTVAPFRALLRPVPGLSPGDDQRDRQRQLPGRVRQSTLGWWSRSEPRPTAERMLLVGVAVWSGYDLNLLDLLDRAVAAGVRRDIAVFVFDVDEDPSHEALNAAIPGIGQVHHTPAVGYWEHGELVDKVCGFHGRQLIGRLFGIDDRLLHERITLAS